MSSPGNPVRFSTNNNNEAVGAVRNRVCAVLQAPVGALSCVLVML